MPDLSRLKIKALKQPPNVRVVVDADHHFHFTAQHKVNHVLVVFKREFHAVASGLPLRWGHVVEGVNSPLLRRHKSHRSLATVANSVSTYSTMRYLPAQRKVSRVKANPGL